MGIKLVCTHAFGDFKPGDEVTDPEKVTALLETHEAFFVKVANTSPADDPA